MAYRLFKFMREALKMRCSKARKLIHGYVDGALEASTVELLEAHLASCERCRREETRLRDLASRLAEWTAPRPVLGFDALLARMEQRASAQDRRQYGSRTAPSWAVAALVAGIAAGTSAGLLTGGAEPGRVPSEQEVVGAIDLHTFGDTVETAFVQAASTGEAEEGRTQ